MVAKYRVALSETEIAKLTQLCFDAKEYELYVLLNKQLSKISGGIRQPDYAAAGVRAAAVSNVIQTANTAFTIKDDNYIPGTTIRSNATIREKFTLMGHTRLTWAEMDMVCIELGMDTSIPDRDAQFFNHLQCHTGYVCNTLGKGNTQCDAFDMAIDMIADDNFIGNYMMEIHKYNIYVRPVLTAQMIDTIDTNTPQPNTVVDVLNKFGL